MAYRTRSWLWRVAKDAIATKAFLWRRSLVDSMRCPRCHDYGEDIFHLIVDYSKSRYVWEALGERTGARHQVESMR